MLASLLYSIARLLVDLLSIRDREQAELQAEVLALRHQLRVHAYLAIQALIVKASPRPSEWLGWRGFASQ
jgi:hypothetical protein